MSRYTDFPRNTKQAYLRTCAQAARDAKRRAEQEEQAYAEHNPTQIANERVMVEEPPFIVQTAAQIAWQRGAELPTGNPFYKAA
jgi:hypothetical protein